MKAALKNLKGFRKRWILNSYLRIILMSVGIALFAYLILNDWIWGLQILLFSFILFSIRYKPWSIDLKEVVNFLDISDKELEYSSGLLTKPSDSVSGLAKLQQHKIATKVNDVVKKHRPPISFKFPLLLFAICIILGALGNRLLLGSLLQSETTPSDKETITFIEVDSTQKSVKVPRIINQLVLIDYPAYTNIPSLKSRDMNVKAVEGTRLTWTLEFDTSVNSVSIKSMDKTIKMNKNGKIYSKSLVLQNSGFYSFSFEDSLSKEYISDLYFMERIKDKAPEIDITGVDEFNTYEYFESKIIDIEAIIKDDFGLSEAFIIATLSRGEGEAIQFREERLEFNTSVEKGDRESQLNRSLDLDQLNMQPGDELYFLVEAMDLKRPNPNIARSKTYFAVIKDTLTSSFGVEGNLGADLMPDYFRSQRQLIIDTEKLIRDKPSITEKEFKFRSNELGFDQKALRLKYGQFMGDEADSGLAINQESEGNALEESNEKNDESEDPLADYTHDHDSEDHQHEGQLDTDKGNEQEDPLHDYLHDHGDPESATLFEKSLKVKLREAMNEMWDAELYLRLYEPEKSLPFQYRALRLIQEIKNSARIYVHRIGFDPPPIKEENRLTGTLEDIGNYKKQSEIEPDQKFEHIIEVIDLIEKLIQNKGGLSPSKQLIFTEAGDEVAKLAIDQPGRYLTLLQRLKWLSEGVSLSQDDLVNTRASLFEIAASIDQNPSHSKSYNSGLNKLFLKELLNND